MIRIPKISDKNLEKLYKKIKPVIDRNGIKYYIKDLEFKDLRNTAYLWDPIITEEAINIIRLHDIITFHSYGYYGLFKPSIAEVLAQIPKSDILFRPIFAFEITGYPQSGDDLNKQSNITNEGYHMATTTLYVKRD